MLAIVKSLLIYPTGVELDILDEKGVNQVFASFQKSGYNLKSLMAPWRSRVRPDLQQT